MRLPAVLALAVKDLRLLIRDRAGVFFTFFFPLIIAVFFGVIFSGTTREDPTITLLLVDLDQTESSRAFVHALEQREDLHLVERTDAETARELVRTGRTPAAAILPSGFGHSIDNPFTAGAAEIRLLLDPSRAAESGMLRGVLFETAYTYLQKRLANPETMKRMAREARAALDADDDINPPMRAALRLFLPAVETFADSLEQTSAPDDHSADPAADPDPPANETRVDDQSPPAAAFQPIDINASAVTRAPGEGPPNYYAISFAQGAMWSVIGATAGFAISLVVERTRGTLVRLRLAPVTAAHILAGKALACFTTCALSATLLFIVAAAFFGVRPDSPALLALTICCVAACFVGVMMLLSVLGRTEAAASAIGWAILLLMAMLGGAMIPVFLMPDWLQAVSHLTPVSWSIRALEGAIWRGDSFTQLLTPLLVLLAIGLTCFALGAFIFSRRAPA